MATTMFIEQRVLPSSRATCVTGPGSVRVPSSCRHRASRRRPQRIEATAALEPQTEQKYERPDAAGRFGRFGGKYVPETLISALTALEASYKEALADPAFQVQLTTQAT